MLKYAPTNEQEIVFLFAYICKELGYTIKRLQTEFPDCILMDRDNKELRAEFEYASSNFILHKHPISKCDIVIAWKDDINLKDKIKVIALKEYFPDLPKNPDVKIEDKRVNKTIEGLRLIATGEANKENLFELFKKYHPKEREREPIRFIARLIINGGEPYIKNRKVALRRPIDIQKIRYSVSKKTNVLNEAKRILQQLGL